MHDTCAEYARLQSEVSEVLQRLTELTSSQLKAFQTNDSARFTRLDNELELAIGEKERCIGALREHAREHRCQPFSAGVDELR